MKTNTAVFWTVMITVLFQANACWSQMQPNGAYGGSLMPAQAGPSGGMQMPYTTFGGNHVVAPASFCGDASGPIGLGADCGPCVGACGGICGGGCGGGRGLLRGALGNVLGLGGLAGGGLAGGGLGAGGGGWLDIEYLLLWSKERYIPELVTTGPVSTPVNVVGRLGQPTTQLIYGDTLVGGGPYSGVRVSGGRWLDPQQSLGLGGRFFFVGGSEDFDRSSEGDPVLARPFFDTSTNAQDALVVAYPGISHGNIDIKAANHAIGFDIYFRKLMLSGYCNRLDFIGGYHNSCVEDSVEINNTIISDDPAGRVPLGTEVSTRDYFEVKNQFNGGFVGIMGTSDDGPLSWNLLAKVALGNMNQEARISGRTRSSVPGAGSFSNQFGLLALPSNIGSFDRDEFAVVPEVNLSVGYKVTDRFKVLVGYTFIYWSKVGLAGDLIDTTIDGTQLTGAVAGARPRSRLTSDGFFYSGLSIGGSLRF